MFTRTKTAMLYLYQAQVPRLADLPSKSMSSTAGSLRSSGALWHRALVLRVDGQSPSMRVDPRSTHRLPLGTPRYGEVFLRHPGGGSGRPPSKPPGAADRLVRTLSKVHGLSKAARHKSVAGAPASPASRRGGLTKNLASAPASPCWDVPEGVVLRPP